MRRNFLWFLYKIEKDEPPLHKRLLSRWFLEKPSSASWQGWEEWKEANQRQYPVRYFLQEDLVIWFSIQFRRMKDARYWVYYRVLPKQQYHRVDTGLPPGYYDVDTRLFHANFNLLKEFVEIENASEYRGGRYYRTMRALERVMERKRFSTARKLFTEWWVGHRENKKRYMGDREAGMKTLAWRIELHNSGQEPGINWAREARDLYIWWNDARPGREKIIEDHRNTGKAEGFDPMHFMGSGNQNDSEHPFYQNYLDWDAACQHLRTLEEEWDKEDTDNLVRLVNIRKYLWT